MGNIKKIFTPGLKPAPTSFGKDDLVINVPDGKLYIKNTNNSSLRVINADKNNDLPLDGNILINKKLEFKLTTNSDNILFISASGNNPRLGIGTTEPKANIDFKSVDDSSVGTELILRTARSSTTGAFSGDEGGSINFTIDSGSFAKLTTSGSLAKIKTIVNSIGAGGAQGILAFTLSKGAGPDGVDAFKYGYYIGGESTFAQIQTGSLVIHDLNSGQPSKLKMVDHDDTINFQAFEGDITASGNVSCSGDLIGNINGGTF